jgi:hypothetical protein
MSAIRIETDGAGDFTRVYQWVARHRGQNVELEKGRSLALGAPISGARAVIVAVAMQLDGRSLIAGVLRALSSQSARDHVRLVFEGRSPGSHSSQETEALAVELVDLISAQVAAEQPVEKVA